MESATSESLPAVGGGSTSAAKSNRSYTVVFVGFAAQMLLQFALSVVLARIFGASLQMDAYRAALTLPIGLSAALAGSFGPVLIAMLSRQEPEFDRKAFAGTILAAMLTISILLAVIGSLTSESLMSALLPNYGPAEIAITARLFRVLVWLIPANTLIGLFQSLLNASLVFSVPAFAGIVGPLLTVGIVVKFGPSHGVYVVAVATCAGAVLNLLVQVPSVLLRMSFPRGLIAKEQMQRAIWIAGPVLCGMLVLKVDPLVDRHVSSYLPTGRIAQLDWSYQVVTIFVMLASGTLSTVAFPRIATHATLGSESLADEIGRSLRALATLSMPAFAALIVFAEPLVRDIFERGEFTAADTAIVSSLVRIYAFFLIGAALGELCSKTMYAMHDSVTPTVIGTIGLTCGFILKLALVPTRGITTLVIISSAVYLVGGACQLAMLRSRTSSRIFRGLVVHVLKCLVATAAATLTGGAVLISGISFAGIAGLLAGAVVYFGTIILLDTETRSLAHLRKPR